MKSLKIQTKLSEYEIKYVQSFDGLVQKMNNITEGRDICIVTDKNVEKYYLDQLVTELNTSAHKIITFVIEPGENSKNLNTVYDLYELLIKEKFDRKALLIALGGGVVGDLTGFAAATYLRGIDFIGVPTSLLAQVDSSIGGKTGVDFKGYKNMIGAFYQPRLVLINISTLSTLPIREFNAGVAELIKHAFIKDEDYLQWIENHITAIKSLEIETLYEMIYKSCLIKKQVVELDEKELNLRALLNFGHTIGHAIEKIKCFQWLHGECVAIGMVAAAYISYKRNLIDDHALERIKSLIQQFSLPVKISDIDPKAILATTKLDKKVRGNVLHFVLLDALGKADLYTDLTDEELLDAISYIVNESYV